MLDSSALLTIILGAASMHRCNPSAPLKRGGKVLFDNFGGMIILRQYGFMQQHQSHAIIEKKAMQLSQI